MIRKEAIQKINDFLWEIPKTYREDMRVPARIYASSHMLEEIFRDRSLDQLVNVATLPGIQSYALAMPDVHEGYGFPVGGVAAFDTKEGVISPGGIGYDINCGVRLLVSEKNFQDAHSNLEKLAKAIYVNVPSGVGKGGKLALNEAELDKVLKKGALHIIEMGYGEDSDPRDLAAEGAEAALVSREAKARGRDQLGTMGAGNHFVEVEVVEKIFDKEMAQKFRLFENQIGVLIHTGSRGLGHQIATDYIRRMNRVMPQYNISLPDRELASAPFTSNDGQEYFHAMLAGINFAYANRQLITWEVREAWRKTFGKSENLRVVGDVVHNTAKLEEYHGKQFLVHRKGATRSFPGELVFIPGSMGTASYVLVGEDKALGETFGSSCHGAGRRMSRSEARRKIRGSELKEKLGRMGISIQAGSLGGLAEEAPEAYKNVDEVVDVVG